VLLITVYVGRNRWAETSPTLTDYLWFYVLHSELFAEHNGFPTARDGCYCPTGAWLRFLDLASLEPATLSVLQVHRLVRGCHTTPEGIVAYVKHAGSLGGARNAWSGQWRRRWRWNTLRRKEAETYDRGCPAGVSQYVETMVPGTCPSNRWAMFDAPSVRSSWPVSCDAGLRGVWSRRHPRLRLRGSHPWVRMGVP
jgi:hypothetical protein